MQKIMFQKKLTQILLAVVGLTTGTLAVAEDSFYKGPALFSTRPDVTKSEVKVSRFGPVGIGINLVQPAFQMRIRNVEEGSPAAATGKLKTGQYIESINGQKLKEIDPRIQLGKILAEAEATNGEVRLKVADAPGGKTEDVLVKIPILGRYSKTWPLNCPKSSKIVRDFGDFLATKEWKGQQAIDGFELLFLLSTGEKKDLETAKKWVKISVERFNETKTVTGYAWYIGLGGVPLCEYYLRTGDKSVLPLIEALAKEAKQREYQDGWAGRGGVAVSYGHLNAAGTAVVTFLLLAKECGIDVSDDVMMRSFRRFYRYSGKGINPYGDHKPEVGFIDNGKNGNLAFTMGAAASLTPDGENSVYANARDTLALYSFYSTTFMFHGHTGGGIGEIWRGMAAGLLHDKHPTKFREFFDNRVWFYDLSRRYTGSFGIIGGGGYDKEQWGCGIPLSYTIPRKKLRICGAPKTPFVKQFKLPERVWGTKADDLFVSTQGVPDKDGKCIDLSKEVLAKDASKPIIDRFAVTPTEKISDEELRSLARHQNSEIRRLVGSELVGINSNRLGWRTAGGKAKPEIICEFLRHSDPRMRRMAIDAILLGMPGSDSSLEGEKVYLTDANIDLLVAMIKDPEESWWVKDGALQLLGRAPAEKVVPHVDLILTFLKSDEWWLQNSALTALTNVAADERCYKKVLPAVGDLLRSTQRRVAVRPASKIVAKVGGASEAVRELAAETIEDAFNKFEGKRYAAGGQDIVGVQDYQMEFLAEALAQIPGGYDRLYEASRERFPDTPLPYQEIFLHANPDKFGSKLRKAINPLILQELIPAYIGTNHRSLRKEIDTMTALPGRSLWGLVDLYHKAGKNDYNWHTVGPELGKIQWDYYTFDPPEKQAYDKSPWRFREVTYPKGMENWYSPDFNPQKAGWKKGFAPFGQREGKLLTDTKPCSNPSCKHSDPMKTLWDKEVLLLRAKVKVPPAKPGYLYRVRVGTGQHVGSGDGYQVYVNGKLMGSQKSGVGRRAGGRPRSAAVTKEFLEDFKKGEVTIAAMSFLRYGSRAIVTMPPVPQGIISVWVEEMKIPPVTDAIIKKALLDLPMLSTAYYATLVDDDKFQFDGKFVADSKLVGEWEPVAKVEKLEDFKNDPEAWKKNKVRLSDTYANKKTLELKKDGVTNAGELLVWSKDTLMDLNAREALKMFVRKVDGEEFLFIEAGGFNHKTPQHWQCPHFVFKRK